MIEFFQNLSKNIQLLNNSDDFSEVGSFCLTSELLKLFDALRIKILFHIYFSLYAKAVSRVLLFTLVNN